MQIDFLLVDESVRRPKTHKNMITKETGSLVLTVVMVLSIVAIAPGTAVAQDATSDIVLTQASSSGDKITYDVQLTNSSGGVGTFSGLNITINDTNVAEITSISAAHGGGSTNANVASDGSSASVDGGLGGDTADSGTATFAQVTIQTNNPGSALLEISNIDTIGNEPGDTTYNIASLGSDTIAVGNTGPTDVVLSQAANSNGTITYNVQIDNSAGGVGTFNGLNIQSNDTKVAKITSITAAHGGGTSTSTVASDGSTASVAGGIGGNTADSGTATFAKFTIQTNPGKASIDVTSIGTISNEPGSKSYTVAKLGRDSLNIGGTGPEVFPGRPSNDTDNDGKLDDLNGDGASNPADAQALYKNTDSLNKSSQQNRFDFNNDGVVNIVDAQNLYAHPDTL